LDIANIIVPMLCKGKEPAEADTRKPGTVRKTRVREELLLILYIRKYFSLSRIFWKLK
jgi:hypothetical protein